MLASGISLCTASLSPAWLQTLFLWDIYQTNKDCSAHASSLYIYVTFVHKVSVKLL